MSQVVDIRQADDPRDVIHQAVHLLADGGIAGLPTETGYVLAAHALNPQAVAGVASLTRSADRLTRQFALKSAQELRDYVPSLSRLGSKPTRRCWPGPVAFVLDVGGKQGLLEAVPAETRSAVVEADRCGFRVPADQVFGEILRLTPAPLVVATEHPSGSQTGIAREAAALRSAYGDAVALVIDNGPCQYEQPASIVEVDGERWQCAKPGVVNQTMLGRLASEVYLFVCTGNTCRSPMAEAWFRKLLSDRLQCGEDDLIDHGYLVTSAGLGATVGAPASPEAVTILTERGVDLRGHESRPLTDRLLDQADHIITMTRGHRDSILSIRPDLADVVAVLSPDGGDVPDPMGYSIDEYRSCEAIIEKHVRAIVEALPRN